MNRALPSLFLLTLLGILLSGCAASPDAVDSAPHKETDRSPTEESSVPTETPVASIPTVPEKEQDETELSVDELDDTDAPEPWTPPTIIAPDTPHAEQRRSIAAWIRERPLQISVQNKRPVDAYERSESRGRDLLYRSYLNELLADAMIQFDRSTSESSIVVTVTPKFQSERSDKNVYGATALVVVLQLERPGAVGVSSSGSGPNLGGSAVVFRTEIHGPMVLSRISYEDAQLNSLRRIDPTTVRHAIDTLHGELADAVAERGVPFLVTRPAEATEATEATDEDLFAVLRSLGVPDEQTGMWHLYDSPERIRAEIKQLLSDSPYGFLLNPLTREIRFLYNEGS